MSKLNKHYPCPLCASNNAYLNYSSIKVSTHTHKAKDIYDLYDSVTAKAKCNNCGHVFDVKGNIHWNE